MIFLLTRTAYRYNIQFNIYFLTLLQIIFIALFAPFFFLGEHLSDSMHADGRFVCVVIHSLSAAHIFMKVHKALPKMYSNNNCIG